VTVLKKVIGFVKKKYDVIIVALGCTQQLLEASGVSVPPGVFENLIDLVTILALGSVMKKSEAGKLI
jgi:hypothetical protein